jgi:hypothetical protein
MKNPVIPLSPIRLAPASAPHRDPLFPDMDENPRPLARIDAGKTSVALEYSAVLMPLERHPVNAIKPIMSGKSLVNERDTKASSSALTIVASTIMFAMWRAPHLLMLQPAASVPAMPDMLHTDSDTLAVLSGKPALVSNDGNQLSTMLKAS